LSLGDNFYKHGVESVQSARFRETWANVYSASVFDSPWLICAGNHDYRGNIEAQIAYTFVDPTARWTFPARQHVHRAEFRSPSSGSPVTVDIVILDTVALSGSFVADDEEEEDPMMAENDPSEPDTDADGGGGDADWDWVEDTLAASNATWLIVAGHYPVYSIGGHGPTESLANHLLPIMESFGVAMYISGHDHSAQFLRTKELDFVVSGGGREVQDDTKNFNKVPERSVMFHWGGDPDASKDEPQGVFASMKVIDDETMETTFVDHTGLARRTIATINPRTTTILEREERRAASQIQTYFG